MRNDENKVDIPINVIYSEIITNQGRYNEWINTREKEYFEYRKEWSELPQKFIVRRFPLNLDIEPTNDCNLKCPFCYRTLGIKMNSNCFDKIGYMSLRMFEKIINQVTVEGKCMVPAFKLTHRGEPLLNKELPDMVRMAKEAGVVDVMINTNATLLTAELSEKLLNAGLDRLLISFDSPQKDVYESIRVGASFENVFDNIVTFVKLRNERKEATRTLVRVGMVLTENTEPDVEKYKSIFENIADVISFNKIHEEIEVRSDGVFFDRTGKKCNVADRKFADSQLWQRMTINWNGDAEICCENYKQEYYLGNINEIAIEEIWNGERFNTVRNLHEQGRWSEIPQCRKCTIPYMEQK